MGIPLHKPYPYILHTAYIGLIHVSQVEAPVEMSSFSVVLPCAFEGEFAEKTVWAVWENTAPWFWKWKQESYLANG